MADRPTVPGPLAGVRVLALTEERAALAVKELGELGAEVILIEPPEGASLRRIGPFLDDRSGPERSLSFAYYHAGHRSVVADLGTAAGRQRVRDLAVAADILIEDRAPGELARFGRGHADLLALNPRLIYVALSPFGQTGPRRAWRATDLIGWAAGGPMSVTGPPEGPPLRAAGHQADQMGALWATAGALAGLIARRRTGRGQVIDVSLQEAVILGNDTVGFTAIYTGRPARRRGSEHVSLVPQRVMSARDGYLMMAIVTQGQWQEFLAWLREDCAAEPLDRPEWRVFLGRLKDRDLIHARIEQWVAGQDRFPLMAEAQRRGLPIAALSTPADVLADEHLADQGFFTQVEIGGRALPFPAGPYLSSSPLPSPGPAPTLGEHQNTPWSPPPRRPWAVGSRQSSPRSSPTALPDAGPDLDTPRKRVPPTADSRLPTAPPSGPLAGVRVLDFGWMIAGAFCSGILGDLGADVIKIEPREIGEPFREIPPFAHKVVGPNTSGAFNLYNRNKRGSTIDVRRSAGRELALRLIAWADVIVENWSAGTFERLGFDEPTIRAANPNVVWVRMAGFGQTGPHRHYVSVAPTLSAASGLTYLTGPLNGPPTGPGVFWADFIGAVQGAIAAMAGLYERERTGLGQTIDLAQFEATVRLLGPILLDYAANGRNQPAAGNALPDRPAGPHGAYRCRGNPPEDRWLASAVTDEAEWQAFRKVIGDPEWAADPRFATAAGRAAAGEELDRLVESWTTTQDNWEAATRLQEAGVPAMPVVTGLDLAERDDHLRARRFYETPEHPVAGSFKIDRSPIVASRTPLPPIKPAPLVGQHTEEVLREVLGLSQAEIDRLILDEVV